MTREKEVIKEDTTEAEIDEETQDLIVEVEEVDTTIRGADDQVAEVQAQGVEAAVMIDEEGTIEEAIADMGEGKTQEEEIRERDLISKVYWLRKDLQMPW